MDSEESILANRICGCATNQQHSADVAAIREYRANVVAPFLDRIEALEAQVRELERTLRSIAWPMNEAGPWAQAVAASALPSRTVADSDGDDGA